MRTQVGVLIVVGMVCVATSPVGGPGMQVVSSRVVTLGPVEAQLSPSKPTQELRVAAWLQGTANHLPLDRRVMAHVFAARARDGGVDDGDAGVVATFADGGTEMEVLVDCTTPDQSCEDEFAFTISLVDPQDTLDVVWRVDLLANGLTSTESGALLIRRAP